MVQRVVRILKPPATLQFTSKNNRDKFKDCPGRFLPEFGGFCAFGASVGKKIYADPTAWRAFEPEGY
jgi:hypothetical protein